MGFLQPWVLLGLPLAGLPLLLHLIQRRDPPTVEFPAVRYLVQVTQEHQRRLRLRHLLLLLVRTALILALVLASAGPSAALRQAASHAPSALVVILDNSPSSGAIVDGTPRLEELRLAARRILARATPADALWLVGSDGLARRGSSAELTRAVDSLETVSRRLDLGQAVQLAAGVVATDQRPGAIVLLSDLQATALSPAAIHTPLLVAHPASAPPHNLGVTQLRPSAAPWTPSGGEVTVGVEGDSGAPAPVTVTLADRPGRQALILAGAASSFSLDGTVPGWWTVRAAKAPDELRIDDDRVGLIRVAPVARVAWNPADSYLDAALGVLETDGRLRRGTDLTVGTLGVGASVVMPPADPAQLGAMNRALERRDIGWRYGALIASPAMTDSGALVGREAVARRYLLEPRRASATSGVLATVGRMPWLVRSGDVVLLGSRLEPAWTGFPLRAGFLPFMDAVVNRLARGDLALQNAAPGDPVLVPDLVTGVTQGDRHWTVEGGAAFRAPSPGVYFLLSGRDTVGGISVNVDARESHLAVATGAQVTNLWPGSRVMSLTDAPAAAFAGAGRASLQGPLLWLALLLGLLELLLASGQRARA
ncbi:MAG: VWA domain-containing protein [Gemmatimonadales bacterium]